MQPNAAGASSSKRPKNKLVRKISRTLWNLVRVLCVAAAALGPGVPPPPPPPQASEQEGERDGAPADLE